MTLQPDDAETERVERALREWGQRPPQTAPAAATRQVLARLEVGRRLSWQRSLLAAAAATLIAVGVWVSLRSVPTQHPAGDLAIAGVPAPMPDNVVVWWLDSQTPVYFVMRPTERR